jgi:HEAT repeat protein
VPVLISFVKRRVNAVDAAYALGDIGDLQAGPVLVELLNSKERLLNEHLVIGAIAKLKYQPGAAVLAARLQITPEIGWFTINEILDALLEIGDRSVITNIEKYLQGEIPNEARITARRVLIQLKQSDPVPGLLDLLQQEPDERWKGDIIRDLARYKRPTVVTKLTDVATNSDSAFLRREAIWGLKTVGNRQALLALAGLLDTEFPTKLKAEHGWKGAPKDWPKYFRELLPNCLSQATKQEFGTDSRKWQQWIETNVKE